MKSRALIIGDWTVDALGNRISGQGKTVELEPRVMDLLMLFAARAGEVISKTEMIESLWDEVHVNDDALTRCIFKLRKALDDDAKAPQYIETVSKRGYRLIADVSGDDAPRAGKPKVGYRMLLAFLAISIALGGLFVLTERLTAPGAPEVNLNKDDLLIVRADGFYARG